MDHRINGSCAQLWQLYCTLKVANRITLHNSVHYYISWHRYSVFVSQLIYVYVGGGSVWGTYAGGNPAISRHLGAAVCVYMYNILYIYVYVYMQT